MGQADRPPLRDRQPDGAHPAVAPLDPGPPPIDPLFTFVQLELPWTLAPLDGRYTVRRGDDADAEGVLVFQRGQAPPRRQFSRRRLRSASTEPEPVPISRVTVVAAERLDRANAESWLASANGQPGERAVDTAVSSVNRALHAFATGSSDPFLRPVTADDAVVIRLGFGTGPEVAEGEWSQAVEARARSERRAAHDVDAERSVTQTLAGRSEPAPAEALVLRARQDLEVGRPREAALQARSAVDAILGSGGADIDGISELRERQQGLAEIAGRAAAGPLSDQEVEAVREAVRLARRALRRRRTP